MNYKILNTVKFYTDEAKQILESLGSVNYKQLTQQELANQIAQYDIAVITLDLRFDREIIQKANKLKYIVSATTGLDHIDLNEAKKRGVQVISLKGEEEFLSTITGTAELAFGLLIDLLRGISNSFEEVKQYRWDREKFRGHSLSGKTLGIVGLGRLGKAMARYGNVFDMKVIACDPYIDDEEFQKFKVRKVSLNELMTRSDVISLHVHLNDETKQMINAALLKKMKSTTCIINTSRGGIVDESGVLSALEKGQIAGYATDVLNDELYFVQSFVNHPLVEYAKTHNNCIIVPHIGGMTHESRSATDIFIVQKIEKILSSNH